MNNRETRLNLVEFVMEKPVIQKGSDSINVTLSGTLSFTTLFYAKNSIHDFSTAFLYYDAEQRAIGVRFTNETVPASTFRISSPYGKSGSLNCKNFFRSNGINLKKSAGAYPYETVDQGQGTIYVIRIN